MRKPVRAQTVAKRRAAAELPAGAIEGRSTCAPVAAVCGVSSKWRHHDAPPIVYAALKPEVDAHAVSTHFAGPLSASLLPPMTSRRLVAHRNVSSENTGRVIGQLRKVFG